MMDEPEFRIQADKALGSLHESLLDAAEVHDFEADFGGTVTVEFSDPPAKFVVSPNAPVRQIWVSAHSKSYKLDWDATRGTFALPDGGQTLAELMSDAVSRQVGERVVLG